jgi:NitT/TauT family transport system ATP-binding protein
MSGTAGARDRFIVFDRVTKTYRSHRGASHALNETSLHIAEGEFLCIVGPSGCGKTTLLNILAGFVTATSGQVTVGGRPVVEPGPDRGVVFQEVGLFNWLTARKNVEFGLRMAGVSSRERERRAEEALSLTGMSRFGNRYISELSGGMKQRVGLARALANDPQVLLMDEPFAALDAQSRSLMQQEVLKIWHATGKTIVFITHAVDEALLLADRVVMMSANPGRVKESIMIDLPRPRDENGPEFNRIERDLRNMVLAEARSAELAG